MARIGPRRHDMDGEFRITCSGASELFELSEEAFHEVARLVDVSIIDAWRVAIGARRDNGDGALGLEPISKLPIEEFHV